MPHYAYSDLAKLLKLPILVVAPNRLGVINHLLLTLEFASSHGLRVLGYIFDRLTAGPSLAADTNHEALLSLTAVPYLGEIPYVENVGAKPSSLADVFEERIDLRLLDAVLLHR